MSDLNKTLAKIQSDTQRIKLDIIELVRNYEGIYNEANGIYLSEKVASGSEGLEDFYKLVSTIRRNRDVVGSLLKGLNNIRPTEQFRFIEEEIADKEIVAKKARKQRQKRVPAPVPAEEFQQENDPQGPGVAQGPEVSEEK